MLAGVAAHGSAGVTRSWTVDEFQILLNHRLTTAKARAAIKRVIEKLEHTGALVAPQRGRIAINGTGMSLLEEFLAGTMARSASWPAVRDVYLVGRALGWTAAESTRRAKKLTAADGLRIAVLDHFFELRLRQKAGLAEARNALAATSLSRAYGSTILSRMGSAGGLVGKAGRAIASQLAARPREHQNDRSLIAQLAAEQVGADQNDPGSLRTALLRMLVWPEPVEARTAIVEEEKGSDSAGPASQPSGRKPASQNGTAASPAHSAMAQAVRAAPDLARFALEVERHARRRAEGWAGNRRAYIAEVWRSFSAENPEWGEDISSFKNLLAEAHRQGHVVLANADLRSKANLGIIEESAINYKNTEWHLIRVTD